MYNKIKKTLYDITSDIDRLYDLATIYDKTESHKRADAAECIYLIGKAESLITLLIAEWDEISAEKDLEELLEKKAELSVLLEDIYHKNNNDKVVIRVSGGMVQTVHGSNPNISVVIEDEDVEEYDHANSEDITKLAQLY